ncbi:hypothetical protein [Bacillus massiliglaciei]|uniref:hypothetical protein n=1 Tax=Bacillus massiliglaciei TaxID=1816693 RepID=UPI0018FE5DCF|nr:hypothetical protein [Bacillus massiliglaciei]
MSIISDLQSCCDKRLSAYPGLNVFYLKWQPFLQGTYLGQIVFKQSGDTSEYVSADLSAFAELVLYSYSFILCGRRIHKERRLLSYEGTYSDYTKAIDKKQSY